MRWSIFILVICLITIDKIRCDNDDVELNSDDDSTNNDADNQEPIIPTSERPDFIMPKILGKVHFVEVFQNDNLGKIWKTSKAKKLDADESIAKYDGEWKIEEGLAALKNDLGLHLKSKAKHHAIAAKLTTPFKFDGKPLIAQYEVKFLNGQECGGGYIKLLSEDRNLDLIQFMDKTPYTIMFGPDRCGQDNKFHFIFRHKSPKTGEYEEKHAKKPSGSFDHVFDKKTHLCRLVIHPSNKFEIYLDEILINSGSLLEDFEPPVNPPKLIVDPDDKKPDDWDERQKIPDPEAKKPDDWDDTLPEKIEDEYATMPDGWLINEKELVPDPKAVKPADWDDEMDGEWEAPMISNPLCESAPGCGEWKRPMIDNPLYKPKWKAPIIDNPNYKGKWEPKTIDNPNYFEDKEPYKMTSVSAVGLELWSMSEDIVFDNFLITDNLEIANDFVKQTFHLKRAQELSSIASGDSVFGWLLKAAEEKKWLYAVYIAIILLPIVLLSVWCCPSSSKKDSDAKAKKTDEQTPDDEPGIDDIEDDNLIGSVENNVENVDTVQDSPGKKPKGKKSDLDAAENDNEISETEDQEESNDATPRKRQNKPRKE